MCFYIVRVTLPLNVCDKIPLKTAAPPLTAKNSICTCLIVFFLKVRSDHPCSTGWWVKVLNHMFKIAKNT